jgi:hypothetical protein
MLPAGQDADEAFYRIVDAAYERRSIAVTSNIHPSGPDTIMPKDVGHRYRTVDGSSTTPTSCSPKTTHIASPKHSQEKESSPQWRKRVVSGGCVARPKAPIRA